MQRVLVLVLAAAVMAAGCSASFSIGGQTVEDAATDLIEGELTDQIGLGPLTASCPEVEDPEVGTEFTCTAATPDGETIDFAGVVDREDHIDVSSVNVILGRAIPAYEAAGIDLVNEQSGSALDPSAMDCPEVSYVYGPGKTMDCTLTDVDGSRYNATYTFTDTEGGFDLNVLPAG
jgi:hypothetical protein